MNNVIKRFVPKKLYDGNETFDKLITIESGLIDDFSKLLKKLRNNLYVLTCDLDGIKRYEKLLDIRPNADYTIEARRTNILNKLLFKPPFTRQRFDDILFNIYGRDGYMFNIYPNEYRVVIDIDTNDPEVYLQFEDNVKAIMPANIDLIFAIQYTYMYLKKHYTYRTLGDLTYETLMMYNN